MTVDPNAPKPGKRSRALIRFAPAAIVPAVLGSSVALANRGRSTSVLRLGNDVSYGDKLGHFTLYCALTLAVVVAVGDRRIGRWAAPTVLAISIFCFGALEEATQLTNPRRSFDLVDLALNLVGIVVGLGVGQMLLRASQARNKSGQVVDCDPAIPTAAATTAQPSAVNRSSSKYFLVHSMIMMRP